MTTHSNHELSLNAPEISSTSVSRSRVLYAEAVYDEREIAAVVDVLRNRPHQLMNGPAVLEFEMRVAALFGKAHGVMTNSGSSANMLALAALNLSSGSEVITPACTFSTTVAPIVQLGLVPAFVDVEPDSFQIDPAAVEALIAPSTRAIMAPNLIGNLANWPALRDIADRHALVLIEDSADTIGSLLNGAPTGTFSDVSTTSFYASHVMTCGGFGGMACFHDQRLAQSAQLLRGWGRSSALTGESEKMQDRFVAKLQGMDYDAKFLFDGIGYNFLPSEIGAAFGLVQLEKLPTYIEARIRNFTALAQFFSRFQDWFVLPRQTANTRTPWLAVPLIVRERAPFSRRDLQVHFETAGVQTRPIFAGNILRHAGFAAIPRRESAGGYPNADRVMRGGILLGCHHGMAPSDLSYICDVFMQFSRERGL